jgi:hypothetical protein
MLFLRLLLLEHAIYKRRHDLVNAREEERVEHVLLHQSLSKPRSLNQLELDKLIESGRATKFEHRVVAQFPS